MANGGIRITVHSLAESGDEAFQLLKAKLERGALQAERGELLDGEEVFEELRELIEERRLSRKKAQRA